MSQIHSAWPRTDRTAYPPEGVLRTLRPLARRVFDRRFGVRTHGEDRVPTSGPVILACNHTGVMDGPFLTTYGPRVVHALTKEEMFEGPAGRLFRHTGQIPLDRYHPDPGAIRTCVRVLRDGGAVGIFPEGARGSGDLGRFHRGTAYLALTTGAPVVPVIMFGTRAAGGHKNALPPRGGPVDIVYGDPMALPAQPWPRTREQVAEASLLLREHMLALLQESLRLTGQTLPGPLPAGETDDDPHTGVVEQGAP